MSRQKKFFISCFMRTVSTGESVGFGDENDG